VARKYFYSALPTQQMNVYNSTFWIRPPTGQLCIDLVCALETETDFQPIEVEIDVPRFENVSLDDPDAETAIISTLHVDEYHKLCSCPPIAQYRRLIVSTRSPVWPGSIVFHSNSQPGALFRIAERLDVDFNVSQWLNGVQEEKEVMDNSWIRYNSRRVQRDHHIQVYNTHGKKAWLAQANHIFTQLQTTSHLEEYVFVHAIYFYLQCLPNTYNPHEPEGYLFVRPPGDFQTGQDSFQWPECPAYWSLDPSGAAPLSTEDAKILGFPIFHMETIIHGHFWINSVYDGLRQFQRGKGFDPESQELAIHLGYPLYELSSEELGPFACATGWCDVEDTGLCRELGHYL